MKNITLSIFDWLCKHCQLTCFLRFCADSYLYNELEISKIEINPKYLRGSQEPEDFEQILIYTASLKFPNSKLTRIFEGI